MHVDDLDNVVFAIRKGSSGKRAVVVFIHPGNGSVFCYRELAALISPVCDQILSVQSHNLVRKKVVYKTVEEMAELYVDKLVPKVHQFESIHLVGWSSGGLIAFEMAHQLEQCLGLKVASLHLIDSYLSGVYVEGIDINNYASFMYRVINGRLIDEVPADIVQEIDRLPVFDAIRFVFKHALDSAMLPSKSKLRDVLRFSEIHRENRVASKRYVQRETDRLFYLYKAEQNPDFSSENNLGWQGSRMKTVNLDADHYTIMTGDSLRKIAGFINKDIERM